MRKTVCMVLILTVSALLLLPLPSEASSRGVHWSGGGHGAWWVPLAILGGAAALASMIYSSSTAASPAVIPEQPPAYVPLAPSATRSSTEKIFVYPRLGQSEELQARDRYECHDWAVNQTHYDPTQSSTGNIQVYADYRRAENACLDGRGYTVR